MLVQKNISKAIQLLFRQSQTRFCFSEDNNNKGTQDRYVYPYNFNRQQYKGYIKKVQKANKAIDEIETREKMQVLPRRKRRIYDRPKFDLDTTNYSAWRLFDPEEIIFKTWEHGMPVASKIKLQPKWLVHAFGQGILPANHTKSTDRQHVFEDNNLSSFLLYQYRNTTSFKPNDPQYDYENQQSIRPSMRKVFRLSPQQFWQSQDFFEFRLNVSAYAQHLKFSKWLLQTIEKRKSEESYDSIIDKKFGKTFSYNQKSQQQLFKPREPFLKYVNPGSFEQKKEKAVKGKKQNKQTEDNSVSEQKVEGSKYNFSKKLDEKFRRPVTQNEKKESSQGQQ